MAWLTTHTNLACFWWRYSMYLILWLEPGDIQTSSPSWWSIFITANDPTNHLSWAEGICSWAWFCLMACNLYTSNLDHISPFWEAFVPQKLLLNERRKFFLQLISGVPLALPRSCPFNIIYQRSCCPCLVVLDLFCKIVSSSNSTYAFFAKSST